jgi:hypothetical protein
MSEMPEPEGRLDAIRAAEDALRVPADPDAQILAAVREGLDAVPAGSPNSWFDVPTQRNRTRPAGTLNNRRTR